MPPIALAKRRWIWSILPNRKFHQTTDRSDSLGVVRAVIGHGSSHNLAEIALRLML
jgi:hypothetical protein